MVGRMQFISLERTDILFFFLKFDMRTFDLSNMGASKKFVYVITDNNHDELNL